MKYEIIAFTLAETLIVMGIIGVVVALTIPNLNSSTGEAEKVAKVKKIYAELNEAHNRAVAKYGPFGTWFIDNNPNEATKVYLTYAQDYCASDWIIKNSNLDYLKVDSNGKYVQIISH
ncbi:MAG: type II secretion system protein [Candidatus Gastranaerophilaceae bacterium]